MSNYFDMTTAAAAAKLVSAEELSDLRAIEFTPVQCPTGPFRVEYLITDNKVQFHIWPLGDTFVKDAEARIKTAFYKIRDAVAAVDYIPEVVSWYVEVSTDRLPMQLTPDLLESLVGKLA